MPVSPTGSVAWPTRRPGITSARGRTAARVTSESFARPERDLAGHLEPAEHEGAHERDRARRAIFVAERRRGGRRHRGGLVASGGAEDQRHRAEAIGPPPPRIGREQPSMTPSTIAVSRSALIWSDTMRRLSRAWSRARASSWTSAGSTNHPTSSGRSARSAERSRRAPSIAAGAGAGIWSVSAAVARRPAPARELGRRHGAEAPCRARASATRAARSGRLPPRAASGCSRSDVELRSRRLRVIGPPADLHDARLVVQDQRAEAQAAAEAALEEDPHRARAAAVDAGQPGAHRVLGRRAITGAWARGAGGAGCRPGPAGKGPGRPPSGAPCPRPRRRAARRSGRGAAPWRFTSARSAPSSALAASAPGRRRRPESAASSSAR